MRLRILAPALGPLALPPGIVHRRSEDYVDFWRSAHEDPTLRRPAPGVEVQFLHAREAPRFNRYRQIGDDALPRPLPPMRIRLDAAALNAVGSPADHLAADHPDRSLALAVWERIAAIDLRVHDHGIMLVEAEADVGGLLRHTPRVGDQLDALQRAVVELGAGLARACDRVVRPLVEALRARPAGAEMLEDPDETSDDAGEVLWVTRSLVASRDGGDLARRCLSHWLRDVPLPSGERPWPDQLLDGERHSLLRWLNYAFVVSDSATDLEDVCGDELEAMRVAQYYYAAVEQIDRSLTIALARAYTAAPDAGVDDLQRFVARRRARGESVLIEKQETVRHLKRAVHDELRNILDYWGFDQELSEPLREKVSACKAQLERLEAERASRASMYTDVILLGLAVTSILGTAVALADFGRTMGSDPALSSYDIGRGRFVGWIATQPADAIVVVSSAVSMLLILAYVYFRRAHGD